MDHVNINDIWLLLGQMDSKLDRVVTDTKAHETRLKDLERQKNYERGVIASVSAGITLIGSVITYLFTKGS